MSGEKTIKLDAPAKLFMQWEVELYVDRTIGQLTKVMTPPSLKKTAEVNYENSPKQIIALHLALTMKPEINLKDKEVFPQVCLDVFLQATYFYTAWKEACIRVVWLSYSLGHVDRSLTQTMDFSNLWKHCYKFTHDPFHTVHNYKWLTAIKSVTVSLHYLPRCLFNSHLQGLHYVILNKNPDGTPKKRARGRIFTKCNRVRKTSSF